MSEGILVAVSGFSGAGKGTLMKELLSRHEGYALSVSATTRTPRPGEKNGVEYFFKTEEEFRRMIEEDAFIEYARYVDHYYGTPKAYVEEQLAAGRNVILEIEIQGALAVKQKRPDTLLLFVTPPSAEELERRLIGRGTETPEVIRSRLDRAAEESAVMGQYDYIVINDDLRRCTEEMHGIIQASRQTASHQAGFIEQIQKELREREETRK